MARIRYVCLSDMHLGEEQSLLSNVLPGSARRRPDTRAPNVVPTKPSPVMLALVECLRELIPPAEEAPLPTLILDGDILDLALAKDQDAAMSFERFIALVLDEDRRLFDRILYIPGNHDHHIWETARESKYVDELRAHAVGSELPPPRHTTDMFLNGSGVPAFMLRELARRFPHLAQQEDLITIAYPNYGVCDPDRRRCVVFHHGHFTEASPYLLMSWLNKHVFAGHDMPRDVERMEAENFAWIDFLWSMLGRCGLVGERMELVYDQLSDPEECKALIGRVVNNLAHDKEVDLPGWPDFVAAKILNAVLRRVAFRLGDHERKDPEFALSAETVSGLRAYLTTAVFEQIKSVWHGAMPAETKFVFGHTHKPFVHRLSVDGFPQPVDVYNTGGWVVESSLPEARRGASMVLVDDDLDVASVRIYNEVAGDEPSPVFVEAPEHPGQAPSPFAAALRERIAPADSAWHQLSLTIAAEIRERRILHQQTLDEGRCAPG